MRPSPPCNSGATASGSAISPTISVWPGSGCAVSNGRHSNHKDTAMFTLIEALNYRCLRYVRQPLGDFRVLVGPNASGKTTFLDVVASWGSTGYRRSGKRRG